MRVSDRLSVVPRVGNGAEWFILRPKDTNAIGSSIVERLRVYVEELTTGSAGACISTTLYVCGGSEERVDEASTVSSARLTGPFVVVT